MKNKKPIVSVVFTKFDERGFPTQAQIKNAGPIKRVEFKNVSFSK